jgi:hypothetical protein
MLRARAACICAMVVFVSSSTVAVQSLIFPWQNGGSVAFTVLPNAKLSRCFFLRRSMTLRFLSSLSHW